MSIPLLPGIPFLRLFLVLLAANEAASAQAGTPRYRVTSSRVADAFATAIGAPVQAADVTLPLQVGATEQNPELELGPAQSSGPHQVRVRITCRRGGVCLPFLADLDLHDPSYARFVLAGLNASTLTGAQTHLSVPVVHAGQPTWLLLENSFMQIRLPVISIDTGASGTEVRVSTPDRKQTYRGTVADDGTVRSTLP